LPKSVVFSSTCTKGFAIVVLLLRNESERGPREKFACAAVISLGRWSGVKIDRRREEISLRQSGWVCRPMRTHEKRQSHEGPAWKSNSG
jgi:hypothetical protein